MSGEIAARRSRNVIDNRKRSGSARAAA